VVYSRAGARKDILFKPRVLSYPVPVAQRKRTAIISILAGFLMIFSILFGCVSATGFLKTSSLHIASNVPPTQAKVLNSLGKNGILGIFLSIAVSLFLVGVGLWRLRPWARKLVLVWSGICVYLAVFHFWLCLGQLDKIGFGTFAWAFIEIPGCGWPLYYFNKSKVTELFSRQVETSVVALTQAGDEQGAGKGERKINDG